MLDRYRISPGSILLYLCIIAGSLAVAYAFYQYGLAAGLIIASLPCLLIILCTTVNNPPWAILGTLVVNYYIMGISRYIPGIPSGVVLDAAISYNILLLLLHAMFHRIQWKHASSGLTLVAGMWAIYGILQFFNPETVSFSGWFSGVRTVFFHFLIIVVLAQLLLRDFKWVRYILLIWSVLTLTAALKCYIQRNYGFDEAEMRWLFVDGGATTHIIHSGIRFFSFFSDAANFSASMGLSMVVFSLSVIHEKNKWLKFYMFFVAGWACYGMLMSGTRSALAVPFAGYAVYLLLSKNIRVIVPGVILVTTVFCVLNFTTIGQGNATIRRIRSAFDLNDASLNVRLENQRKLRVLMTDKPFGAGIGHGGGKAKEFAPDAPISQIPTDSWYVLIWVETGIVGLILHILILLYILGYGGYLVMCKLQNPEVRGVTAAFTAGVAGIVVMAYANEVLGQIPTGMIVYLCMAFIFMAPEFERQLAAKQEPQQLHV